MLGAAEDIGSKDGFALLQHYEWTHRVWKALTRSSPENLLLLKLSGIGYRHAVDENARISSGDCVNGVRHRRHVAPAVHGHHAIGVGRRRVAELL